MCSLLTFICGRPSLQCDGSWRWAFRGVMGWEYLNSQWRMRRGFSSPLGYLNMAAGTKGQVCGRIPERFPWGFAAPLSALGEGDVLPLCSDLVQAPLFTAMSFGGPRVRSVGCTALPSVSSSPWTSGSVSTHPAVGNLKESVPNSQPTPGLPARRRPWECLPFIPGVFSWPHHSACGMSAAQPRIEPKPH